MVCWIWGKIKNCIKSYKYIIILLASVNLYQGYKHCKEKLYLYNSDTIICVAFQGIEYLFHETYEYYAVNTKSACRIPEKMIIEYFGEEVTQQNIQSYDGYDTWRVSLCYSGGLSYNFQEDNTLRTSYGSQYKIVYYYYGFENNNSITPEEQQKMIDITEELCRGKVPKESSGEERTIIGYDLIHEKDIWYIITGSTPTEKTLIRITDEGKMIKVLEISKGFLDGGSLYFYEK